MTQHASHPPEQPSQLRPKQPRRISKKGPLSLLLLIGLLLLLFTGLLFRTLSKSPLVKTNGPQAAVVDNDYPLSIPETITPPQLHLPQGRYVMYAQKKGIYRVPITGGTPVAVNVPGYIYNYAVPPLITPSGQLLYSGNGLWLADIFTGTAQQIATLPGGQVITSMVLSSDGSSVAWSTEPADGKGTNAVYAGPLKHSTLVYQQDASNCPCFRVFAFSHGSGAQTNTTLLLTDDRGSHRLTRYGLWTFDLSGIGPQGPQLLLNESPQQGPLALTPRGNTLLYSSYEGIVPVPDDLSVPNSIATLNYANSLYLASLAGTSLHLSTPHVVLPEQHNIANSADYHWVTTPSFSPDGHTLLYVEFSSDAQEPFDRHNAFYSVQVSGSGSHLRVGKLQLLATSPARFVELGAWLNNSVVTFYAGDIHDDLYAWDISTGAVAPILQTKSYVNVFAVVRQGNV